MAATIDAMSRRRPQPPSWRAGAMPAIRDGLARRITDEYLPGDWIKQAEMYWVTLDMSALALQAAGDLPEWTPGQAVPATAGVLLWDGQGLPSVPVYTLPPKFDRTNIYRQKIPPSAPLAGVIWALTEVEVRAVALVRTQALPAGARDAMSARFPVVAPACALPLMPSQQSINPDFHLPEVRPLMRVVATTLLLMGQPALVSPRPLVVATGRSATTGDPVGPVVSIIELRRTHQSSDGEEPGGKSPYRHRWVVRGHWRMAAAGPGHSLRRPVYVVAHMKGPEGAPLIESERVNVWRR